MAASQSSEIRAYAPTPEKGIELAYKYRPGASASAPLFFLVHGRAGNYDVMWTFARVIPRHAAIIAPQAPLDDLQVPEFPEGKSWWVPAPARDITPDAAAAGQRLLRFMERVSDHHGLTPTRKIAFGFSQGAAVLTAVIQIKPRFLDGLAVLSGFAVDLGIKNRDKTPSVFMAHGSKDEIAPLEKFEKSRALLESFGSEVSASVEDVGHKIGSASIKALEEWVQSRIN